MARLPKVLFSHVQATGKTLLLDVDGTLTTGKDANGNKVEWPIMGEPNWKTIEKVRECAQEGYWITIFTCRTSPVLNPPAEALEHLDTLRAWLDQHNVPYNDIWPYPKPFGVFVDDNAINVVDFNKGVMLKGGIVPDTLFLRSDLSVVAIDTKNPQESEEFKAWFAGSKVVDAAGNPVLVMHGSHTAGIEKFYGNTDDQVPGLTYFTDSKATAKTYGRVLYGCFLKMENPLVVDAKGQKYGSEIIPSTYAQDALEGGYDGVILKNVKDDANSKIQGTNYMVWNPDQIWKVSENGRGSEAAESAEARKAKGEERKARDDAEEAERKRKFAEWAETPEGKASIAKRFGGPRLQASFTDFPNRWVHYTDTQKLGVNPKQFHGDPAGIYLWPESSTPAAVSTMWKARKYKYLVEFTGSKVLDLSTMDYDTAAGIIKKLYTPEHLPSFDDPEKAKRYESIAKIESGDALKYMAKNRDEHPKDPSRWRDTFWEYLTRPFNGSWGPKLAGKANKFLQSLGYDAVWDEEGVIFGTEPRQLVVLDPTKVKVLDVESGERTGSDFEKVKEVTDHLADLLKSHGKVEVTEPKKKQDRWNDSTSLVGNVVLYPADLQGQDTDNVFRFEVTSEYHKDEIDVRSTHGLEPFRLIPQIKKDDITYDKLDSALAEWLAKKIAKVKVPEKTKELVHAAMVDEGFVDGNWGSRASGILCQAPDGRVLLAKRSDAVEDPGKWGIPGGAIPVDEDSGKPMDAKASAIKEATEELGGMPKGSVAGSVVFHKGDFTYETFLFKTEDADFKPTLNWEHTEAGWYPLDKLPKPLHPGVKWALGALGFGVKASLPTVVFAGNRTPSDWDAESEAMRKALGDLDLEKSLHQGRWTKADQHRYQNMRDYYRTRLSTADSERLSHQQTTEVSKQDTETLEKMLVSIGEQMAPIEALTREEYDSLPDDQRRKFARLLYRREAIRDYLKGRAKAPAWKDIFGSLPTVVFAKQVAYHGTPHNVKKFSLKKIGTGEGAQSRGWGLYFTNKKELAEFYRDNLSSRKGADPTGKKFQGKTIMEWYAYFENLASHAKGNAEAQKYYDRMSMLEDLEVTWNAHSALAQAKENDNVSPDAVKWFEDVILPNFERPGGTYTVDIPEDDQLLDSDAPIKDQPAGVRAIIEKTPQYAAADKRAAESAQYKRGADLTGGEFYGELEQYDKMTPKQVSQYLLSLGIPGLKYNGSEDGESSTDYVIWDEAAIKMMASANPIPISEGAGKPANLSRGQAVKKAEALGDPWIGLTRKPEGREAVSWGFNNGKSYLETEMYRQNLLNSFIEYMDAAEIKHKADAPKKDAEAAKVWEDWLKNNEVIFDDAISRSKKTKGRIHLALEEAFANQDIAELDRLLKNSEAARVRHEDTDYEDLLRRGVDRDTARDIKMMASAKPIPISEDLQSQIDRLVGVIFDACLDSSEDPLGGDDSRWVLLNPQYNPHPLTVTTVKGETKKIDIQVIATCEQGDTPDRSRAYYFSPGAGMGSNRATGAPTMVVWINGFRTKSEILEDEARFKRVLALTISHECRHAMQAPKNTSETSADAANRGDTKAYVNHPNEVETFLGDIVTEVRQAFSGETSGGFKYLSSVNDTPQMKLWMSAHSPTWHDHQADFTPETRKKILKAVATVWSEYKDKHPIVKGSFKDEGLYIKAPLPVSTGSVGQDVLDWGKANIPEDVVYHNPDDTDLMNRFGREDDPHVTLVFGLRTDAPLSEVEGFLPSRPVSATLGNITKFSNADEPFDTVVIEVNSPDLSEANGVLKDAYEVNDQFPDYHPHVTIAYVRKGTCEDLVGRPDFAGKKVVFPALVAMDCNSPIVLFEHKPTSDLTADLCAYSNHSGSFWMSPDGELFRSIGEHADTIEDICPAVKEKYWANRRAGVSMPGGIRGVAIDMGWVRLTAGSDLLLDVKSEADVPSILGKLPTDMLVGIFQVYVQLPDFSTIVVPVLEGEDGLDAWKHRTDIRHRGVTASMIDYPHAGLPTDLWDQWEGEYVMKPAVAEGIQSRIMELLRQVWKAPEQWVLSMYLQGLAATQFYTKHTDIDIQVIVNVPALVASNPEMDFQKNMDPDVIIEDQNEKLEALDKSLTFGSHPLEARLRSSKRIAEPKFLAETDAIYDIGAHRWVKKPKPVNYLKYSRKSVIGPALERALSQAQQWDAQIGQVHRALNELKLLADYLTTEPGEPKRNYGKYSMMLLTRVAKVIERMKKRRKAIRKLRSLAFKHLDVVKLGMVNTHPDVVLNKLLIDWGYFGKILHLAHYVKAREGMLTLADVEPLLNLLDGLPAPENPPAPGGLLPASLKWQAYLRRQGTSIRAESEMDMVQELMTFLEDEGFEVSSRYGDGSQALPTHDRRCPDCAGTGYVPINFRDPAPGQAYFVYSDEDERLYRDPWDLAEFEAESEDGTHFLPCALCGATGPGGVTAANMRVNANLRADKFTGLQRAAKEAIQNDHKWVEYLVNPEVAAELGRAQQAVDRARTEDDLKKVWATFQPTTSWEQITTGVQASAPDVNSPAFKAWFDGSKVVDAEGKPLVVYHATAKNFKVFNFKTSLQKVIWFTSNKDRALSGDTGSAGAGIVMDLYAKITNPAGWDEYGKLMLDQLRDQGFDGVILPVTSEGYIDGFVFEPTQLKSASRNRGTWDPAKKDITASPSLPRLVFDSKPVSEKVEKP